MSTVRNTLHWLSRYKLHHLFFWAFYHFSWWTIYDGSVSNAFNNLFYPPITFKFISYVFFQAIGVYFCLYYLIPRFLEKGQYFTFFAILLLDLIIVSSLILGGYFLGAFLYDQNPYELFKAVSPHPLSLFQHQTFPSTVGAMTLGMSIKLAKNYLESQEQKRELEKEKLETELKFLKSQFNPHFLFNTINSIFVLINKNTHLASSSLAKFSELLRYQLYECNEAQIPLTREINYLQNFIELEELRLNENYNIEVDFPAQAIGNQMIAPFILMPFIENAFKHVSRQKDGANWIRIHLKVVDDELSFEVENSTMPFNEYAKEVLNYNGLGLENVMRRLELLYKNKHQLEAGKEHDRFLVKLNLVLTQKKEKALVNN